MEKTIKVGQMPGRIVELVVDSSATFASVIALAELNATGFEVKADGNKVSDLNASVGSTNLVLLTKLIKGNAERVVKVGQMPGRIVELAVDDAQTFAQVIELADLNPSGFEVKADGTRITDLNSPVGATNLILLAKTVKGNSERTVKVGVMPGRINEFAVDSNDSIASVLATAELDASGYEVKADGSKVSDLNAPIGTTNLILLTKLVKGN